MNFTAKMPTNFFFLFLLSLSVTMYNSQQRNLLLWINTSLNLPKSKFYTNFEQLKIGWPYCQLLHIIYPKHISSRQIRFNADTQVQFFQNFRLFLTGLETVPNVAEKLNTKGRAFQIDGLIRGRLTSTFYFLQKFYEFWVERNGYEKLKDYDAEKVRFLAKKRSDIKNLNLKKSGFKNSNLINSHTLADSVVLLKSRKNTDVKTNTKTENIDKQSIEITNLNKAPEKTSIIAAETSTKHAGPDVQVLSECIYTHMINSDRIFD